MLLCNSGDENVTLLFSKSTVAEKKRTQETLKQTPQTLSQLASHSEAKQLQASAERLM